MIAAAVVVLNQEVALSIVGALVRVAFFIAIAVVAYFFWRDFGRREIAIWPGRAQWVFYAAVALLVVDLGWSGSRRRRRARRARVDRGRRGSVYAGVRTWLEQRRCSRTSLASTREPTPSRRSSASRIVQLLADEDRRVALGVLRRLGLAQRQHQVHEVGRLVALEHRHELLVVDPERVGRVVVDRLELVPDAHVLVHRALAVLLGERVPGPQLHERIDDEVRLSRAA